MTPKFDVFILAGGMSNKLEIPVSILKDPSSSEMEDEQNGRIPSSCSSGKDNDFRVKGRAPAFCNLSNDSCFNSKTKAKSKDCAAMNLPNKLSNVMGLYQRLMVDPLSMLFENKKKKNSMEFDTQRTGFPIKVSIILISLVFILQLLPLASASEQLGNPYHILGVSRQATLKDIRKAYKLLVKEW